MRSINNNHNDTRIRKVRFSCNRCGTVFLDIENCIIPIHILSILGICTNCSAVIKTRDDFVIESEELNNNELNLQKDYYHPEKYI